MFRKLTTKISPASCLAMVALFVALSGGAYAAAGKIGTKDIKNSAVTKAKLKKNAVVSAKIADGAVTATKIADGAVEAGKIAPAAVGTDKLVDNSVTGAKVNESSLGIVPDAAKLAGKEPNAFESKGFGGTGDTGTVNLPTSATTQVQALALPAGTYMVFARGGINNNGSEVGTGQSCKVSAGSSSQSIAFGALGANGKAGDREEFEAFVLVALPAAGEATLSCTTNAAWESGNVTDPSLAAVSLQP